jgi:hypothetical protein
MISITIIITILLTHSVFYIPVVLFLSFIIMLLHITEYGVKDPKTHDHKSQWEHRDGDKVHGEYTLDEADGTKRIVKYSSDKHGGFTAHVERVGHASHPAHYGHHEEEHHH